MAIIKPFCSVRPADSYVTKVAALPYDVYNRQEATTVVKNNPVSFLAIDRAETSFDDSVDTYADVVYEQAFKLYLERKEKGIFIQDEKKCLYLYELVMNGRSQTGIVACASIDDYMQGIIMKHENTRADKEQDRIRHVDSLSAQTGPIFLAHKSSSDISAIKQRIKKETPIFDYVSEDGITHRGWKIAEAADIENIMKLFAAMKEIYIADGHHRCASAVKVGLKRRESYPDYTGEEEFNYFLSVIFSEDELRIFDYNRVVKDLNGYSEETFLAEVSKAFFVEKADEIVAPQRKGQFGMLLGKQWYKLTAKDELYQNDEVADLDVSILQDNLLGPILGIEDPRTNKRIDFVGGIRGLTELERRCNTDCVLAFSMYPTSMQELFSVADAHKLMPPKSTWFEPKLRSGLFIHEIEK